MSAQNVKTARSLQAKALMLGFSPRKWRYRAASLLVVLYALCLVAPTAVLAFNADSTPAHCLTEDSQAAGSSHVHSGQNRSDTGDTGDVDHDQASKCCGLFSVSDVLAPFNAATMRLPLMSQIAPLFVAGLSGQDSDRIDRPPRSLPSL